MMLVNFRSFSRSSLFDDNLREVDRGISNVYALINGLFPDERTAFIFTSDHGMSNKGKILIDKMLLLFVRIEFVYYFAMYFF